MEVLAPAIISAVTSLVVVLITHFLSTRRENQVKEKLEQEKINLQYLNPLRLYLVENYFRLKEILRKVSEGNGKCEALLYVSDAREVSEKSSEWFNGEGCYLVSSSYLTGCLYYYIKKVRDDFPYLRLKGEDDTRLLSLMLKLNIGFLKDLGVFYVTQSSIGDDLFSHTENRLLSYREYCLALQNPEQRVWFDRLLNFYILTGRGVHLDRVNEILAAIEALSGFLDRTVGGSRSIKEKLEAEGIQAL